MGAVITSLPFFDLPHFFLSMYHFSACFTWKHLGLLGIEVNTHIAGKNLDSADLEPVWQVLDDRHAVVFIHPNDVLGAERLMLRSSLVMAIKIGLQRRFALG